MGKKQDMRRLLCQSRRIVKDTRLEVDDDTNSKIARTHSYFIHMEYYFICLLKQNNEDH